MILWAIIRNIMWVVWLHLRSAHGLYLLWSWMYLLGSSYFACTVMVCFTHAQLWCASHWYRNPSAIENHSIYRLPRQMLVAGRPSSYFQMLFFGEHHRQVNDCRRVKVCKFSCLWLGAQIQPKISPWRVHFTVAKKVGHGVMESWLLPWSSLADVSLSALAAGTSWP